MSRAEVVEALTAERYGSQWALRETEWQEARQRLLATLEETERVDEEKSA